MSKKVLSTYEREIKNNPDFKKNVEKEYRKLIISELVVALMTNNHKSVRSLAKECGLSPAAINKLRTGKQDDVMLLNFINIIEACGYRLILQRGKEKISVLPEIGEKFVAARRSPVIRGKVAAAKLKTAHHAHRAAR